ncbi:hypothetical protein MUG84_20830 [Paenibacillus sp. KQZ6P-2]|uniref:Uncharacterized protein n=1 Tax=Paenibacillus mangrovi TaxID=2931978 RepID=A0A9X2B459_9BACL|nr:hypothetical protein [Paenibacillus mangrovi]MCJ8014161.1 hypothetical protein [Paenibacillus mangrovi]
MVREKDNIDVQGALTEIKRLEREVRLRGHWIGWLWFMMGVVIAAFGVLAPPVTTGWLQYVVTLAVPVLGIFALFFAARQQVVSRVNQWIQYPVTWIFCGFVLVDVIFRLSMHPDHLSIWVVILGVLPAIPCWYAAWRVWRS